MILLANTRAPARPGPLHNIQVMGPRLKPAEAPSRGLNRGGPGGVSAGFRRGPRLKPGRTRRLVPTSGPGPPIQVVPHDGAPDLRPQLVPAGPAAQSFSCGPCLNPLRLVPPAGH